MFFFSITESEVPNQRRDEQGEHNGNNFSYKTYDNICNLTELWLTWYQDIVLKLGNFCTLCPKLSAWFFIVMENVKTRLFVFFSCTTEAAVSADQSQQPGEIDGNNIS